MTAQTHPEQRFSCSIFTAIKPKTLTKRFSLTAQGLQKESGGSLISGEYRKAYFSNARGFAELIRGLQPNQVLGFGVAEVEKATVRIEKKRKPDEISRTREYFEWPDGPGVMMLDYDPRPDEPALEPCALLDRLCVAVPAIVAAPMVITSSASAHIHNSETGDVIRGAGGLRVYLLVSYAPDIPRAGKALAERLWLAGFGYCTVSKAGRLMERTLVDLAVWQPERLDFAAGARCDPPLVQYRYGPEVRNDDAAPLDTRTAIPNLGETPELAALKKKARAVVSEAAREQRERWQNARIEEALNRHPSGVSGGQLDSLRNQFRRAVEGRALGPDFPVVLEDGQEVSVGELLNDPKTYDGKRCRDPLEPDYREDPRVAYINLRSGRKPHIWSHAHGGQRFSLERQTTTVTVQSGQMPSVVAQVERALAQGGEVFQRGGELVRIADDIIVPVRSAWLKTHMETLVRFQRIDSQRKEPYPINAPHGLDERILKNRGAWQCSELRGVIRSPTLRPDGSLLDRPGYDPETKFLLIGDDPDQWPPVPLKPSLRRVALALGRVFEPFRYYPFVGPTDRAVFLAALLTATVRPMLPAAPAFAFNAYTAGSGKTKLGQAVALLAGGDGAVEPWSDVSEEQRKALMTKLLVGSPAVILDNVVGTIDSAVLCAILTAEMYQDRRLGASEQISASTRMLFLLTGNNIRAGGDLGRRVLTCTVDHGVERPDRLAFPFDPVKKVKENVAGLRADLLTVLRGFISAGSPRHGEGALGSYEVWDQLVRQAVCWIIHEGLMDQELGDPADVVTANLAADPETNKLRALLHAWAQYGPDAKFLSRDILQIAEDTKEHLRQCRRGEFERSQIPSRDLALTEAVDEIAGERGVINSRMLGRWLERSAGRIVDGHQITQCGRIGGSVVWQLIREP